MLSLFPASVCLVDLLMLDFLTVCVCECVNSGVCVCVCLRACSAAMLMSSPSVSSASSSSQTQYLTLPKSPSPVSLPVHYTPAVSASPLRQVTSSWLPISPECLSFLVFSSPAQQPGLLCRDLLEPSCGIRRTRTSDFLMKSSISQWEEAFLLHTQPVL